MTAPVEDLPEDEFDDAWEMLQFYLEDWGLESLAQDARNMLIEGDSVDVITLKLRETEAYKTRFAANEKRRQQGLPVLSPAEYIATERQYRETLRRFGLPEQFYDAQEDFKQFLENDVSPQELNDRAMGAQARYLQATPEEREQLERVMGLNPGQVLAGILDYERALPILERQYNTAAIAAEAQRAFKDRTRLSVDRAEELARAGVTQEDARGAFGELAGRQERDSFLARLGKRELTAEEQENELLLDDGQARVKRERGMQEERARFGANYLAQETGLRRNTTGAY